MDETGKTENSRDEQFDRLVHRDYYEAVERGESPKQEDLIAKHPKFADELKSFFADVEHLRNAAGGSKESDEKTEPNIIGRGDTIEYIGEYRILEEIARGGMGIVFKARQEKLNRTVALKMILAGRLASNAIVVRFRKEARAAATLQHPNIVGIHELGQYEDHHYFTMDYVEGESLAERLREGSMAPRHAAELLKTVAEAIHYAHQQGVLHRDLKPANVLIDKVGQPLVTDFGLAKSLLDEGTVDGNTETGRILGTASYMPPEQAAAKHLLVGVPSDVYSLGAILYACLSGRAPFIGESMVETLRQVIDQEPVPIRLLNPKVPKDLETICLKCLSKEPHRRYGTAEALADDVQRFLEGKPVLAKPTGTLTHLWKWCKRRPDVATLVTSLSAALLVGFLAVSFLWGETELARRDAETKGNESKRHLYKSLMRESQALRLARQSGYRNAVWSRLKDASQLVGVDIDSDAIRDEAVACLGDFVGISPVTIDGPALVGSNNCVAFLSDNLIAAALGNGDVSIRELATGREKSCIIGSGETAGAILATPGGKTLIIADQTSLQRWSQRDSGTWVEEWRVPAPVRSPIRNMSLLEDRLAIIDRFEIHVLDLGDGQIVGRLKPPSQYSFLHPEIGFLAVAASPDGKFIAGADSPESIFLWNVQTSVLERRLTAPMTGIPNLEFTSDGRFLVVGSDEGIVTFECTDYSQWSMFRMDPVVSIDSSSDGRHLLIQARSGSVQVWNMATQRLLAELSHPGSAMTVGAAVFSPTGKRILSSGANRIRVWEFNGSHEKLVLVGHSGAVSSVAFHPTAPVLVSGSHDGTISFWDSRSGGQIKTIDLNEQVQSVAYSPSGSFFAAVTTESFMVWKSSETGPSAVIRHNHGHKAFQDVCFSPDGKWVATCGKSGTQVWKILSTEPDQPPQLALGTQQKQSGTSITFDPSSTFVAVNSRSRFAWFQLETAKPSKLVNAKIHFSSNLVSSTTPKTVIGVTPDGVIQVWNLESGQVAKRISDSRKLTSSHIAISPSGELAAADTTPKTVTIFDVARERRAFCLAEENASIGALDWEPSGRRLAVGLADGGVAIWDVADIARQLYAADLAGDLRILHEDLQNDFDTKPLRSLEQTWQIVKKDDMVRYRVKQILAKWNIHTDAVTSQSLPAVSDSLHEQLQTAGGAISRSGAFVLKLPRIQFDTLTERLAVAGYHLYSVRPYWHNDLLFVAATWQPSDQDADYRMRLTKKEFLKQHSQMIANGFQLLDLGGYLTEKIAPVEHFYAVWQRGTGTVHEQVVSVGLKVDEVNANYLHLREDYKPVLRQAYFSSDNKSRYCTVWEKPARVSFHYFGKDDLKSMQNLARKFSNTPVRYFHQAQSNSGQHSEFSSVWRGYAASLETRLIFGEPIEVVRSIGSEMLRAGYGARSVCVSTSEFTEPIAAAIWEKWPTIDKNGRIEGEKMSRLEFSGGGVLPQEMTEFGEGRWSENKQLYWGGVAPLDRLTLGFDLKADGDYEIGAVLTTAPDYAIVDVKLDDVRLGNDIDLYRPDVVSTTGLIQFGVHKLKAGRHQLVITIKGANKAAAKKLGFGFDYLEFIKK